MVKSGGRSTEEKSSSSEPMSSAVSAASSRIRATRRRSRGRPPTGKRRARFETLGPHRLPRNLGGNTGLQTVKYSTSKFQVRVNHKTPRPRRPNHRLRWVFAGTIRLIITTTRFFPNSTSITIPLVAPQNNRWSHLHFLGFLAGTLTLLLVGSRSRSRSRVSFSFPAASCFQLALTRSTRRVIRILHALSLYMVFLTN